MRRAILPHIAAGIKMISGNSWLAASVMFASIAILTNGKLARSQSIDLQEKCASQAQIAYQESERKDQGQSKKLGAFSTGSSDYHSHYNTKLQKCFILTNKTQALGDQMSISVTLTDAYERRLYAVYILINQESETHWEMLICELIPSWVDKRICTSREEFDAFVAGYMEE